MLGQPGVILVAEGAPSRVRNLLAQEKKKVARIVGDTPIYDVLVGDGEGQVPLRGVVKKIKSLPKKLSNDEAMVVQQRMKALGRNRAPVPAGMDPSRAPRMSRRALRGR